MKIAKVEDFDKIKSILATASNAGEIMFKSPDMALDSLPGFFLVDDHGCFWCNPIDDQTLEVHATFEPGFRGRYARDLARVGQRQIFSEIGVNRLVTKCKLHHKYVVNFARWMGFNQIGQTDGNIILECPIEAYAMLDNDLCDFAFDVDFPLPSVCPQEQANLAGLFVLCARNGLFMKGLQAYNRMAILMEWEPLLLDSISPILLTIGGRQFPPINLMTEA